MAPDEPSVTNSRRCRLDAVLAKVLGIIEAGDSPDLELIANENKDLQPEIDKEFVKIQRVLRARESAGRVRSGSSMLGDLSTPIAVPKTPLGAFSFKHGDRPLRGYTVHRGVGRGGFGEVYYALSDNGKEVALKYLRDRPQMELRGAKECQNLKSPYLVTIFNIEQNEHNDWFVIMEYVAGPTLRDLLNNSEDFGGTAPIDQRRQQTAAFFLREIAKGIAQLHDRGIAHRDLKPGNIFFDEGFVKIGDYGLSKLATSPDSQHSTVGTIHYMAPEVGTGNYSKSVDIYSLGIVLFEMLTGRVPFTGDSLFEVAAKHLSAEPVLDDLPAAFTPVIRKALAKNPASRYQHVTEMVRDLFRDVNLEHSLGSFEPANLSLMVRRLAHDHPLPSQTDACQDRNSNGNTAACIISRDSSWEDRGSRVESLASSVGDDLIAAIESKWIPELVAWKQHVSKDSSDSANATRDYEQAKSRYLGLGVLLPSTRDKRRWVDICESSLTRTKESKGKLFDSFLSSHDAVLSSMQRWITSATDFEKCAKGIGEWLDACAKLQPDLWIRFSSAVDECNSLLNLDGVIPKELQIELHLPQPPDAHEPVRLLITSIQRSCRRTLITRRWRCERFLRSREGLQMRTAAQDSIIRCCSSAMQTVALARRFMARRKSMAEKAAQIVEKRVG